MTFSEENFNEVSEEDLVMALMSLAYDNPDKLDEIRSNFQKLIEQHLWKTYTGYNDNGVSFKDHHKNLFRVTNLNVKKKFESPKLTLILGEKYDTEPPESA